MAERATKSAIKEGIMDKELQRWMGRIEVKLDTLTEKVNNHLKHHWVITVILLSSLIGVVIRLLSGG